jgi:large subunit ribosomal protein L3
MIGILGKKVGMTQVFDEDGRQIPVTVLDCSPCYVTAIKTKEKDGYQAVQLAYGKAKESRAGKALMGHIKKSGLSEALHFIREIRSEVTGGLKLGAQLSVKQFEAGDYVDVVGVSKGKGFQGVVKRHGFKGGESAHGSKFGREAGSTGQNSTPGRTYRGRKMAGHMGTDTITKSNCFVVNSDEAQGVVIVRGSIPGHNGGYVVIRNSLKKGKSKSWKIHLSESASVSPAQEAAGSESKK